jgi:hypothetical protein
LKTLCGRWRLVGDRVIIIRSGRGRGRAGDSFALPLDKASRGATHRTCRRPTKPKVSIEKECGGD